MLGKDFRSFIQEVKEKYPSEYIEIEKEISPLRFAFSGCSGSGRPQDRLAPEISRCPEPFNQA